jgi:hypothetical protein
MIFALPLIGLKVRCCISSCDKTLLGTFTMYNRVGLYQALYLYSMRTAKACNELPFANAGQRTTKVNITGSHDTNGFDKLDK